MALTDSITWNGQDLGNYYFYGKPEAPSGRGWPETSENVLDLPGWPNPRELVRRYAPRTIVVKGTIWADSRTDLDTRIGALQKLFALSDPFGAGRDIKRERPGRLQFRNLTDRHYRAVCTGFDVEEFPPWRIQTYANAVLTFRLIDPFAQSDPAFVSTTSMSSTLQYILVDTGNVPSFPKITVHGVCTNPKLTGGDKTFVFNFNGSLAGEDAEGTAVTATHSGTANYIGTLLGEAVALTSAQRIYTGASLLGNTSQFSLYARFIPSFAYNESGTEAIEILRYHDGTRYMKLYYDKSSDQFAFKTYNGATTKIALSAVQTFAAGDVIGLVGVYDAATSQIIVNGVAGTAIANTTGVGAYVPDQIEIDPDEDGAVSPAVTLYMVEIAGFARALSVQEAAALSLGDKEIENDNLLMSLTYSLAAATTRLIIDSEAETVVEDVSGARTNGIDHASTTSLFPILTPGKGVLRCAFTSATAARVDVQYKKNWL